MSLLRPFYSIKRAYLLTPDRLRQLGVSALILDVDNTLTTHGNPEPDALILDWLACMKQAGVPLMILSNNSYERVKPFADRLGLPFESSAAKPLPGGYHRCCSRFGLPANCVAVVGDQLFTDVAGGNLSGVKSILVEPIQPETGFFFRMKRQLERPFLKHYTHNGKEGL